MSSRKKAPRYQNENSWGLGQLTAMEEQRGIDFDRTWKNLSKFQQNLLLYGFDTKILLICPAAAGSLPGNCSRRSGPIRLPSTADFSPGKNPVPFRHRADH
jgi:hypothetical protein